MVSRDRSTIRGDAASSMAGRPKAFPGRSRKAMFDLSTHFSTRPSAQSQSEKIDEMLERPPNPPNFGEAWKRCVSRLRAELGEDVYSSWFGRLELDSVVEGVARLSVPTKFLKSWIDGHYT